MDRIINAEFSVISVSRELLWDDFRYFSAERIVEMRYSKSVGGSLKHFFCIKFKDGRVHFRNSGMKELITKRMFCRIS